MKVLITGAGGFRRQEPAAAPGRAQGRGGGVLHAPTPWPSCRACSTGWRSSSTWPG